MYAISYDSYGRLLIFNCFRFFLNLSLLFRTTIINPYVKSYLLGSDFVVLLTSMHCIPCNFGTQEPQDMPDRPAGQLGQGKFQHKLVLPNLATVGFLKKLH